MIPVGALAVVIYPCILYANLRANDNTRVCGVKTDELVTILQCEEYAEGLLFYKVLTTSGKIGWFIIDAFKAVP